MAAPRAIVAVVVAVFALLAFLFLSFATGIGLGVPEAGFVLGFFGLAALNFLLIIAAVVHALVRDDLTGVQRLVWIAVSVFVTPIVAVGAIVYFALGRERTAALFRDLALGRPPPPAPPAAPPPGP